MNPHNQNNYFSFKRGILALTLGVNLVSLSFFSEINQKAVWAKSETNIISNITPVLQLNNRGLLLARSLSFAARVYSSYYCKIPSIALPSVEESR